MTKDSTGTDRCEAADRIVVDPRLDLGDSKTASRQSHHSMSAKPYPGLRAAGLHTHGARWRPQPGRSQHGPDNAYRGFDSIDPADLRGRMRWWGLYTQRKPGIESGRTGALEPEELDDRYFMMRVRVDGGTLTTEQLRVLGEV